MKAYVYGEKRDLPAGFETFSDRAHTAIVSIDMHEGHLADTPDCPCPAPRAREIVAPIDAFHDKVRALGIRVETGEFGAMMKVSLVNEGPATFIVDSTTARRAG